MPVRVPRCSSWLALLILAGCVRQPASVPVSEPAPTPPSVFTRAPADAPRRAPDPVLPVRYPLVTPITVVQGRVLSVNPRLRFVIADFSFQNRPQLNQSLGIFRGPQRVGTVRVTGPFDDAVVVADVLSGEAAVGDQLRPE